MPLEFALRPRIRLRDDFAAPPRRSRLRLPRLALPVLGYWLAAFGITYALVHAHDSPDTAPLAAESLAASEPPADVVPPTPASEPEPAAVAPEPEPNVVVPPPTADEQAPLSLADAPRPSRFAAPREERVVEPPRARTQSTLSENDIAPLASPFRGLEPPSARAVAAPPLRERETARASGSLPSCEAAAAAATQDLDFASSDRTADLPSSAIAGVLENGAWLGSCELPTSTSLDVCVAIQGGRVTAATVISRPADARLNACVKQRAAALQFPYSSRVDIARTRF
ncbi:MAG TPA: hypothetical protein VF294_10935 [Polyangiaceae bacterium]